MKRPVKATFGLRGTPGIGDGFPGAVGSVRVWSVVPMVATNHPDRSDSRHAWFRGRSSSMASRNTSCLRAFKKSGITAG
jgi:hypothetical protein